MRRAGFLSLFFGLESLDDEGLVRIRKGITYPEIRQTLEAAHGAGLFVVGSLIFPLPHESEASRDIALARIQELAPSTTLVSTVLISYSGSWAIPRLWQSAA